MAGEVSSQTREALDMPQPAPQGLDKGEAERRLLVFRKIAAPLLAVVPAATQEGPAAPGERAARFAELIDTTIALTQRLCQMLGLDQADSAARWQAAVASTEIVAAHFRVTSHVLTPDEAAMIVTTLGEATLPGVIDKLPAPVAGAAEEASTLNRSLKALAPITSAITRFSFGRDPMELLAEVARRLTQSAAQTAGKLEGKGEPSINTPLYFAVLEVAGEFYAQGHFDEMTRLLELPPEERKQYFQLHNPRIPMEPIWEPLAFKLEMLEALTAYLPGGAAS